MALSRSPAVPAAGLSAAAGLHSSDFGIVWGRQQGFIAGVLAVPHVQPALVAGVFQETADKIRHAGDHFANGHVFADAPACFGERELEIVGHAAEGLKFQGGFGADPCVPTRQSRGQQTARCACPAPA